MRILAIDPGPEESGVVGYEPSKLPIARIVPNAELLDRLQPPWDPAFSSIDVLAIEMIASYGMPVGREVFETCVWIGRFVQAWAEPDQVRRVPRLEVKLHLCHSARAKDSHIWQALLDRFGPVGTKRSPGYLFGIRSHARAALALAVTVSDQLEAERPR